MLHSLWARGSATATELWEHEYGDLAYTTVMSTLCRLFRKGLLLRTKESRAYRYTPQTTREDTLRNSVKDAVRKWVGAGGNRTLLLSSFVDMASEEDPGLLELAELVERKRRSLDTNLPSEVNNRKK